MLRVIGVGFGRTGTRSTKEALELLGFGPCHHMAELFAHPETIREWLRAAQGGPVDWSTLLAGYRSTVDWPSVYFWRDLIEVYPNARVLLTVRDPQRWYDSVSSTIYQGRSVDPEAAPAGLRQAYEARPELLDQPRLTEALIWQGTFGGRFADREHALRVYADHVAEVRATVPTDRLLEFDVAQGWQPLCDFLGVDLPAEPFPLLNTSAAFRERLVDPAGLHADR
ncbi:sulfotransferase family protein [Plantactinospora endophytica]|uniref:Sulfotransferase family protein n=1 Tax=Plantactinospora endophytica TaxID=673535 RepID=A0ABQ4E9B7_9ACTN|nr:sulfotransferase family protein [Plantactinospora endophytica]GIG91308.1 sulfotransferase family protein [Plantactinospora endophytica]